MERMTPPEFEKAKTIMPGMEEVVEAGDTLVITDQNGQEISVRARESDVVIDFMAAFDSYMLARLKGVQGVIIDQLWHALVIKYDNLPSRIRRGMPTSRRAGISGGLPHNHP